jgi:hypothetical protein
MRRPRGRRPARRFMPLRQIGPRLLELANEDMCPAELRFQTSAGVFNIKSKASRVIEYQGVKYRLLIGADVNGKEYPYILYKAFSTPPWIVGGEKLGPSPNTVEGRTILRRIYEEVNKDLKSYYANSVKIIKPGTYLLHNLVDSSCMLTPPTVRVFTRSLSGPPEEVGGNLMIKGHEGKLKGTSKFQLRFSAREDQVHISLENIELMIFTSEPVFAPTPEGKFHKLSVELLRRGHVCRPEPPQGYILDCCRVPELLRIFQQKTGFICPSLVPGDSHDDEIHRLITTDP